MKLKLFLMIHCLVCICFFSCMAQNAGFSGQWTLDRQQTHFGGLEEKVAAPFRLEVRNAIDTLFVLRYVSEDVIRQNLPKSGKDIERITSDGNTLVIEKLKKKDSPTELCLVSEYEVGGNEWRYHRQEDWRLSKDGKVLTIVRVTTLPDKVDKVIAVYTKKNKGRN